MGSLAARVSEIGTIFCKRPDWAGQTSIDFRNNERNIR